MNDKLTHKVLRPLTAVMTAAFFAASVMVVSPLYAADGSSVDAHMSNKVQWAQWVLTQVEKQPGQQALIERRIASDFDRQANSQPLYNPTLDLDYSDKVDEEYGIAVSQTIDWSGKQGASSVLASASFARDNEEIAQAKQAALADALNALIEFDAAQTLMSVAQQQDEILTDLGHVIAKRQQAGDLGQLDVELGYLSLSESLQNIGDVESAYYQAQAALKDALAVEAPAVSLPSNTLWQQSIPTGALAIGVEKNADVALARQLMMQSQAQAELARLNKKVDPTLGFGVGKDGDDDVLGFRLSIPLNFRNTYSAEHEAAQRRVLERELLWRDTARRTKNALVQKRDTYMQYTKRWQRWESLTNKRINRSEILLRKQWQAGDISTSDYLFALQQRADAITAGISLQTAMKKSWVSWLLATGQVDRWLSALNS